MSSPSISVMNCGRAFSLASHLAPVVFRRPIARELLHRRELHALRRIRDRFRSGHFVALMRRRRSRSASSGTCAWKGRIAPGSPALTLLAVSPESDGIAAGAIACETTAV